MSELENSGTEDEEEDDSEDAEEEDEEEESDMSFFAMGSRPAEPPTAAPRGLAETAASALPEMEDALASAGFDAMLR